jgi:hypothetical protein
VNVIEANAHRGMPLVIRGDVRADGDPCANVMVELYLRDASPPANGKQPKLPLFIGAIATNEHGEYGGSLVVPGTIPLGDYDVTARTQGDQRCGGGGSQ